jgi:nucleotide-binding universal stress UspA family protein
VDFGIIKSHVCTASIAEKDHNLIRDEARELLHQIEEKSVEYDPERRVCNRLYRYLHSNRSFSPLQLSLILEYIPGRVTTTLDRLIALYRPDSVVVGTRGRRPWQGMAMGFGMGSVSK